MTTRRTIHDRSRASLITVFDGLNDGEAISLRSPSGFELTMDAGELAKALNRIVPGFRATYTPPNVEHDAPDPVTMHNARVRDQVRIDEASALLRQHGYEVKAPSTYVSQLAAFTRGLPNIHVVESDGGPVSLATLVGAARGPGARAVYVEVDRAMLLHEIQRAVDLDDAQAVVGGELWSHLWPVVIRVDEEGDIVLHVTSGERAQS